MMEMGCDRESKECEMIGQEEQRQEIGEVKEHTRIYTLMNVGVSHAFWVWPFSGVNAAEKTRLIRLGINRSTEKRWLGPYLEGLNLISTIFQGSGAVGTTAQVFRFDPELQLLSG